MGPKTRNTWKKSAQVATHQVLPVPLTRKESESRKRSMEDSLHDHHEGENSLKKKCKTVSGVVSNNDPISVAAVGQPRRSQ